MSAIATVPAVAPLITVLTSTPLRNNCTWAPASTLATSKTGAGLLVEELLKLVRLSSGAGPESLPGSSVGGAVGCGCGTVVSIVSSDELPPAVPPADDSTRGTG